MGMSDIIRYRLADVIVDPKLQGGLIGRTVRIYSGDRCAWWRPNAAGYTTNWAVAWRLPFDEAWKAVSHLGPEKQIAFEVVE